MSEYEVVRSDVDGWDVRVVGETDALSNHPTRELAEQAAHLDAGEGAPIDVHEDVVSESPEVEIDAKKTLFSASLVLIGVTALIAIISVLIVLTGFPD